MDDEDAPPSSYAELFDRYYDYVIYIVRRSGIRDQDAEDVASEILVKFYERDFLSKFDPEAWLAENRHRLKGAAAERPPKFRGFLRAFVSKYVLQWRDKQYTRDRKEPYRCEEPAAGDGSMTLLEVLAPVAGRHEEVVEYRDYIGSVRRHLAAKPQVGWRDLERAFVLMVAQVEQTGKISRRELAAAFGVSETAVYQLVSDVRRAIREMQ